MPQLNIVLVEPEIPQNTGNISRTCAATGSRLHLVGPMGFTVDDRKLKRAGLDYWHLLDITYYDDIEDFFARKPGPFFYFSTKARQVIRRRFLPGRRLPGIRQGNRRACRRSCWRKTWIVVSGCRCWITTTPVLSTFPTRWRWACMRRCGNGVFPACAPRDG